MVLWWTTTAWRLQKWIDGFPPILRPKPLCVDPQHFCYMWTFLWTIFKQKYIDLEQKWWSILRYSSAFFLYLWSCLIWHWGLRRFRCWGLKSPRFFFYDFKKGPQNRISMDICEDCWQQLIVDPFFFPLGEACDFDFCEECYLEQLNSRRCRNGHLLVSLGTSRDDGWGCDGKSEGGCRSKDGACIRKATDRLSSYTGWWFGTMEFSWLIYG
jgi:hypothetical protein